MFLDKTICISKKYQHHFTSRPDFATYPQDKQVYSENTDD